MNLTDMLLLGFSNLWRTKLRSLLTILGVVVGIGALTSMVSFGSGMQKNITDSFAANDLFTSITVTQKKVNIDEIAAGGSHQITETMKADGIPLTDSLLESIRAIEGVVLAYPNLEFPARIKLMEDSASLKVAALPSDIRSFKPFNDLLAGSFFVSDTAHSAVIREEALVSKFNIRLLKDDHKIVLSHTDSLKGVKLLHPDSLIGKSIDLVSVSVSPMMMPQVMLGLSIDNAAVPFKETVTQLKICGIMKQKTNFDSNRFGGAVIIPIETAQSIPKLGFNSVWDLLDQKNKKGTYASIHVRIDDMKRMDKVKKSLEEMGVGVFTIADQLQEIKRVFLIINAALGAIGAIALIVAGLGIINTMIMTILERTREIGIMKAIGGSEREIRMIFFAEAAAIGTIGAIFGIALGVVVTKIANWIMNIQLIPEGVDSFSFFYFPTWLIVGAIAFSILISLAAGLYPAMRAARIDPVMALRHD